MDTRLDEAGILTIGGGVASAKVRHAAHALPGIFVRSSCGEYVDTTSAFVYDFIGEAESH
jgi:hypothetical protein